MDEAPVRRSGDEDGVMQTLTPGLDDASARPASDQLAVKA